MIRALLIAALATALFGACTQHNDDGRGSGYHHGGGDFGPSFSTRILP